MKFLRGRIGEKKTELRLWLFLNNRTYHRFHNLIIPSSNGTSQIDHLVVSSYGIFIIETKNKSGWIFGSKDNPKWTQVIYGNKYTFQNPLRQTYRQKKVLAEFFNINLSAIYTLVYFVGDSQFKTELPENVIDIGPAGYIKSFRKPILTEEKVSDIVFNLTSFTSNSTLTNRDHVKSLKRRHDSKTICPKCGGNLVIRTARRGHYNGKQFIGCSNFPSCRYTKKITQERGSNFIFIFILIVVLFLIWLYFIALNK